MAGSQLNVLGSITTPITIGCLVSEPHQIKVVADITGECIIGLDFMEKYFISVDTTNRQLTVQPPDAPGDSIAITPLFLPQADEFLRVVSNVRTEIGPRSVGRVQIKIKDLESDIDGYVEGLKKEKVKLMVPYSLHQHIHL